MGYILFSAKKKFRLHAYRTWDGIIQYSYNNNEWKEWYGEEISNNNIYLRGINNTTITNNSACGGWYVEGNNIKCQGNIENLLDYKSVINNIHPTMTEGCFAWMFEERALLIDTLCLPFLNIYNDCYRYMFYNCKTVKISPMFPNLQIAREAVINQHMFDECSIQFININNKLYDVHVLKLL